VWLTFGSLTGRAVAGFAALAFKLSCTSRAPAFLPVLSPAHSPDRDAGLANSIATPGLVALVRRSKIKSSQHLPFVRTTHAAGPSPGYP